MSPKGKNQDTVPFRVSMRVHAFEGGSEVHFEKTQNPKPFL